MSSEEELEQIEKQIASLEERRAVIRRGTGEPSPHMPAKKLPKPGASWRVLAHGPKDNDTDVRSVGVFDELVVDAWIHLEQMDDRAWWMQLGPLRIWIALRPNGDTDIHIERDGDAAGHVYVAGDVDTRGGGERTEGTPWWSMPPKGAVT